MKRLLFHSLLSHTSSMVNILSATITKSSRFCCVAGPSPLFPLFPQNINLQSDGMLSLPALQNISDHFKMSVNLRNSLALYRLVTPFPFLSLEPLQIVYLHIHYYQVQCFHSIKSTSLLSLRMPLSGKLLVYELSRLQCHVNTFAWRVIYELLPDSYATNDRFQ